MAGDKAAGVVGRWVISPAKSRLGDLRGMGRRGMGGGRKGEGGGGRGRTSGRTGPSGETCCGENLRGGAAGRLLGDCPEIGRRLETSAGLSPDGCGKKTRRGGTSVWCAGGGVSIWDRGVHHVHRAKDQERAGIVLEIVSVR